MIRLQGEYFDGIDSRGETAQLIARTGQVELHLAGTVRSLPLEALKVDSRLGTTPRRITWGERASFVTVDQDGADQVDRLLPNASGLHWVAWLERHMAAVVVSLVLSVAIAVGFAVWGVPAVARVVAAAVPPELSMRLGDSSMTTLDELLSPSELSEARQAQLQQFFFDHGQVERLAFRKAGRLGANALTLSGTHVMFTDELVALADRDEELLAVYLHELGHARMHHVERTILQNSAWAVLLTVITGDFSGAAELVVVVPLMVGQMAYSRDLERDADAFAVDALRNAGLSPEHLATMLEKLEASHTRHPHEDEEESGEDSSETRDHDTSIAEASEAEDMPPSPASEEDEEDAWARRLFEYFSTHPATAERVATIRAQMAR